MKLYTWNIMLRAIKLHNMHSRTALPLQYPAVLKSFSSNEEVVKYFFIFKEYF